VEDGTDEKGQNTAFRTKKKSNPRQAKLDLKKRGNRKKKRRGSTHATKKWKKQQLKGDRHTVKNRLTWKRKE